MRNLDLGALGPLCSAAVLALACSGPEHVSEPPAPDPTPAPPARFESSYRAEAWSMAAFDAGEPPSFFLPFAAARAADVRNGFGWLTVDDHVVWLSYAHRERAGAFGPPIALAVTPDELCSADVQALLQGWDGQPYALELLHDWTPEQLRCLEGHRPHYLASPENPGQSRCDQLVQEDLLSDDLRGLRVSECSTVSLQGLARRPHLEQLALGGMGGQSLAPLTELRELRSLWLFLDAGAHDALVPLSDMRLEQLTLSDYTPSEADLEAIGRMPALTRLRAITPTEAPGAWPLPPTLRALDVMGLDAEGLRRVCASASIRELRVGIAEALGEGSLECLRGRTTLEALRLGAAPLGEADLEVIGTLTGLRDLDLSGVPLTHLGALRDLRSLRALRLGGARVADEELAVVAALRELRVLSLDRTPVTSLAALAGMPHLHRLTALDTGVADDSLDAARALPELYELALPRDGVTAAGADRLRAARPDVLVWGPGRTETPSR